MSKDLVKMFGASVTTTSTTPDPHVGALRIEDGVKREYTQADDAITANNAVVLDVAASATGKKVTPSSTALDQKIIGCAEMAFADEAYGPIVKGGVGSVLVATGTAAGDLMAAGGTAGVLAPIVPRYRTTLVHQFGDGATLVDGTTYKGWVLVPFACTLKAVHAVIQTAISGGTSTLKVLKAASNGNTMLSAASVDPTTLVAGTATALALSAVAADLALTAAQAIYVELVCGTMGTDGVNIALALEVEPTSAVQYPCGIAMQANSSGSDAAKNVYFFPR